MFDANDTKLANSAGYIFRNMDITAAYQYMVETRIFNIQKCLVINGHLDGNGQGGICGGYFCAYGNGSAIIEECGYEGYAGSSANFAGGILSNSVGGGVTVRNCYAIISSDSTNIHSSFGYIVSQANHNTITFENIHANIEDTSANQTEIFGPYSQNSIKTNVYGYNPGTWSDATTETILGDPTDTESAWRTNNDDSVWTLSAFDLSYTQSGTVIGSYISGATVTVTTLDENTIYGTTITDSSGNFEFTFASGVTPDAFLLLSITGGNDILTNAAFTGNFFYNCKCQSG